MNRLPFQPASWRVKYRLFAGFSLIGLVGCGIALILSLTMNNLYERFRNFMAFSENVEIGLDLSATMIELQRLSGEFVNDGQPLAADQAELVLSRASGLLDRLEDNTGHEQFGLLVQVMREHLKEFGRSFTEVRGLRERQVRLVTETISGRALLYRQLLSEYETAIEPGRGDLVTVVERLRTSALQIERHMNHYFDRLDNALIREINNEVRYSRDLLRELPSEGFLSDGPPLLAQMDAALRSYQSAILEAVQLTRGFLYLVNVVMAAETYEITFQARRLTEELNAGMERIEGEMATSIERATGGALAGTLLTLCLVTLLSWRLGAAIAGPIEKLTQGFRCLARGESTADINRAAAGYEFRELSHAAMVFREKIEETRHLLGQYRELSEDLECRVDERTRELEKANRQLETLSRTDELTRLANRRLFNEVLEAEWGVARRSRLQICVLMLDIDCFKSYNDHYGHLAGDDCLRQVAKTFKECIRRQSDLVARYGGEEFVVILPDTDGLGALSMAETLRRAVSHQNIPHAFSERGRVTISVGAAVSMPGASLSDASTLVCNADHALYLAKRKGRNRVFLLPFERITDHRKIGSMLITW